MANENYTAPSDEELKAFAVEWWKHFAFVADPRHSEATYVNDVVHSDHLVSFAKEILSRYGQR